MAITEKILIGIETPDDMVGSNLKQKSFSVIMPWVLVTLLALTALASFFNEGIDNLLFFNTHTVNAEQKYTRNELYAKIQTLQTQNNIAQLNLTQLIKENEELRATSERRAAAISVIAIEVTDILEKNARNVLATLGARLVPYVGIPVQISLTTIELKEDCDLATSLAELNAEHGNAPIDTEVICKAADMVPSPRQAWDQVKAQGNSALKTAYGALESTASMFGLSL